MWHLSRLTVLISYPEVVFNKLQWRRVSPIIQQSLSTTDCIDPVSLQISFQTHADIVAYKWDDKMCLRIQMYESEGSKKLCRDHSGQSKQAFAIDQPQSRED